MGARWPAGFERIPDEEWTRSPIEGLALKYDTVEHHGWYSNLDRTVEDLEAWLRDGHVLLDYSGGTGILAERLLEHVGESSVRILIVDSSPKFLRLALEKLRKDDRVAFRLIRYLKDARRLQRLDEVVDAPLLDAGFDAVSSTNAIHLYHGLSETLASWRRALRPGGRAFIQSGNIRGPHVRDGEWIIDETVEAIHGAAVEIVHVASPRPEWTEALLAEQHQARHAEVRRKYFLPVRPLHVYLDALREAGFNPLDVTSRIIRCRVDEWFDFLAVYHEGVLGWYRDPSDADAPPSDDVVRERLALLRRAMDVVFAGSERFEACWTYITSERPT